VATVGELTIILEAQDRASAQLRGLGQDVARLDRQVETASSGISRLGQIGLAGAGIGVIVDGATRALGAVGALVTEASDLNEQLSRTGVVFGQASGAVTAFAATTAQALGISRTEALAAAGSFGTLFAAAGLSQEAAADMSTDLVRLAADLASFNNIDPREALDKLRSGLVGEAEPLRAVGVLLNETAVKAKAAELGLGGLGRELTEAEKVQARYRLILEQTQTAQGDFARTSEGLANSQRILRASVADIRTELGEQLLPVVARAAAFLARELPRAIQTVRDVLQQLAPVLQAVLGGDLGGALDQILVLLGGLTARLAPVLAEWGQAFLAWVQAVAPPLLAQLGRLAEAVWGWIEGQAPAFLERLTGEWAPAFLEWVAPIIPPLLRELGALLLAVGTWVVGTGLPALVRLGVALGEALVRGLAKALERIGPAIGEALDAAFASNPVVAAALAGALGPAGTLLTPGARAAVAGAAPALGGAAGAANAAGQGVTVNIGGVDVQVGLDPQAAAQQAGAAVAAQVLAALTRSAAATDPGAQTPLAGNAR
jgi:hypothetical protein